jgi:DNA polymerase-3 subunit delta
MIIFLHGPETFLSRRKLNEIVAKKTGSAGGFNVYRLAGADFDLPKLKETVERMSIFETKKIIILENVFGAETKTLSEVAKFISSKKLADDRDNLLIFWEEEVEARSGKSPLFKILTEKPAFSQKFENLNLRQLKTWILCETEKRGGKISQPAVEFLSSAVGNDLWRLSGELDKLVAYKNGGIIALVDVKMLVATEFHSSIFDLIDALGRKDRKAALRILNGETGIGRDELEILGMVAGHFRRLVSLRSLMEAGRLVSAVSMGFHPFVFQKVLNQSRNFTLADLKNKFRKIVETDFMIKTGKIDKKAGLETLIFNIGS